MNDRHASGPWTDEDDAYWAGRLLERERAEDSWRPALVGLSICLGAVQLAGAWYAWDVAHNVPMLAACLLGLAGTLLPGPFTPEPEPDEESR